MEKFSHIAQRAADRKGGFDALAALCAQPNLNTHIADYPDSELLAQFTMKVFQSGFVWRVVRQKWSGFEEVFFNFDIEKILMMPDEMLERKAQDPRIIRNFNKVKTIRHNALMINDLQDKHGRAAQWLADWPSENITGLWLFLKQHGARLGGNTGPYALRALGKDTFILSSDIETYFRGHDLISGGLTSKRNLAVFQTSFNQWQQESALSLQEISQIIAYSVGDNIVQLDAVGA